MSADVSDKNVPPVTVQAPSPGAQAAPASNVLVFVPRPVPVVPRGVTVPLFPQDGARVIPFPDLWSDRQNVFPDVFAAGLTYDLGLALGIAAGPGDYAPGLQGFLIDARVLTRRHNLKTAARMMGVSLAGLRGFRDGAGY